MEPPMDPMMAGGALTPEQVQAFMEYAVNQGAFTEQDRAVQQQLAIANELRNRQGTPHTTGIGGGLGAIGGFLRNIAGAQQAGQAREQDRALQQARIEALRNLAAGYGRGQQAQQMQQPETGFIDPGVAAIYAGRRRQQANPYYVDPGSGGD